MTNGSEQGWFSKLFDGANKLLTTAVALIAVLGFFGVHELRARANGHNRATVADTISFSISVQDASTAKVIRNARVVVYPDQQAAQDFQSDVNGDVTVQLPASTKSVRVVVSNGGGYDTASVFADPHRTGPQVVTLKRVAVGQQSITKHTRPSPQASTPKSTITPEGNSPSSPVTQYCGSGPCIGQVNGPVSIGSTPPPRRIRYQDAMRAILRLKASTPNHTLRIDRIGLTDEANAFYKAIAGIFIDGGWHVFYGPSYGQMSESGGTAESPTITHGEGILCSAATSEYAIAAREAMAMAGYPCQHGYRLDPSDNDADWYIRIGPAQ